MGVMTSATLPDVPKQDTSIAEALIAAVADPKGAKSRIDALRKATSDAQEAEAAASKEIASLEQAHAILDDRQRKIDAAESAIRVRQQQMDAAAADLQQKLDGVAEVKARAEESIKTEQATWESVKAQHAIDVVNWNNRVIEKEEELQRQQQNGARVLANLVEREKALADQEAAYQLRADALTKAEQAHEANVAALKKFLE